MEELHSTQVSIDHTNPVMYDISIDENTYILNLIDKTAVLKTGRPRRQVIIPEVVQFKGESYAIKTIDYSSFYRDSSIEELIINGGNLIIKEHAFKRCPNLQRVILRGNIQRIERGVFYGCLHLKEVILSGTVDQFGTDTFAFCPQLERFVINGSISTMGNSMFRSCSSLKRISLPIGLKCIPEAAFIYCSALESVDLPPSIKEIGKYAFLDCESLTQIDYGDDVILGDYCFKRTPLDPEWGKTHPTTDCQIKFYRGLDDIKLNLISGKVLSPSRSIYNSKGRVLEGDALFSVIKDFMDGTSIHYAISDKAKSGLKYVDYQDSGRRVYFYPCGDTYNRICRGTCFIRMVENGGPFKIRTIQRLIERGIPQKYIDDPKLWMSAYLQSNHDIPVILAEALKGVGFPIEADQIKTLALENIRTNEMLTDRNKGDNFLYKIAQGIHSIYFSIDKRYKSCGIISGELLFKDNISTYIYLYNLLCFKTVSYRII